MTTFSNVFIFVFTNHKIFCRKNKDDENLQNTPEPNLFLCRHETKLKCNRTGSAEVGGEISEDRQVVCESCQMTK